MEFEKVKEIIVTVLDADPDAITMESSIIEDLGADSLDVMQIIMAIEDEYGIEIKPEIAEQIVTVGDVVDQLKNVVSD